MTAPSLFEVGRPGLAVIWVPLGESGPAFDPTHQFDSVIELAQARSEVWKGIRNDFLKLEAAGWRLSHDRDALWAKAYQSFESYEDAQVSVRDALYGKGEMWLPGMENEVTTRRVDWYGGPRYDFKLGGFVAGEEQRRTPEAFPLWVVALDVLRARKVSDSQDILAALMKLGDGTPDPEVLAEVASLSKNRPLPTVIEAFPGLGDVELVSEAWLHFAGRIEVLTELPELLGHKPWLARYLMIPSLAEVWAEGARLQAERSQLDINDEIRRVEEDSVLTRVATQANDEFGTVMRTLSQRFRDDDEGTSE